MRNIKYFAIYTALLLPILAAWFYGLEWILGDKLDFITAVATLVGLKIGDWFNENIASKHLARFMKGMDYETE